jgi:hypothetical protein
MALIFWLPLIAVLFHICEEFVWPGGFLAWDRLYRPAIAGSVSTRFAVVVNSLLIAVALLTGLVGPSTSRSASLWLILMAALAGNAVFHLNAVVRTHRYSPGAISAALLYVPLCVGGYIYFLITNFTSWRVALTAIVLGASYNFWSPLIHRHRAAATT